ncbi:hypothetical protein chiPu_0028993 [Chiloscyllium punctatum]|uniref:Uncharacterized protein n=1 Tax=Chiloscyllium punctatum TaxID=137246 RepID=A0A401TQJ9_CHIPU|nr:hypothetical protein [Chiloscyllium punctatum]
MREPTPPHPILTGEVEEEGDGLRLGAGQEVGAGAWPVPPAGDLAAVGPLVALRCPVDAEAEAEGSGTVRAELAPGRSAAVPGRGHGDTAMVHQGQGLLGLAPPTHRQPRLLYLLTEPQTQSHVAVQLHRVPSEKLGRGERCHRAQSHVCGRRRARIRERKSPLAPHSPPSLPLISHPV